MDAEACATAAGLLAKAWASGTRVSLPEALAPRDLDEAREIQDGLFALLDQDLAGWKLAMTSPAGQARAGYDHPFTGQMFSSRVKQSPAAFPKGMFHQPLLEAEIAFRMKSALGPRAARYTTYEVLDAVDSAIIGVEVADVRYAGSWPFPMPLLAADNGAFGAFVSGPDIPGWRDRDLMQIEGALDMNGKQVAGKQTGDERTDAIAALVWLVNDLSTRGYALRAGDLVTTGSATVPTACPPGTAAVAHFPGIGEVRLSL
jgi:2-keto-4-pentenoate hydratase